MTAARQVQSEPPSECEPGDELPAVLLGFNWEFSDAERERFGEAIMSAIDSDGVPPPVKESVPARTR